MIVTIHQPEHLPWLGFFDKITQADCFVMLDHVQFRKNYFQNRNRIRSQDGSVWLSVPVRIKGRFGQPINQVEIDNSGNPRWREKCWRTIVQAYGKATFFSQYAPFFERLYQTDWERLVDLNETIIQYLFDELGVRVRVIKSSTLPIQEHSKKSDLVLEIARLVGAQTYLSGVSGQDYLELERFKHENVEVRFQEFNHPVYSQQFTPFLPCMSTIDLLFTHGPESLEIIKSLRVESANSVAARARSRALLPTATESLI
jgi:hypothetical protein